MLQEGVKKLLLSSYSCGDNDIISLSNKDWDDIGIVSTNEDLECQDREVKRKVSSSEASRQDIGIQPIALNIYNHNFMNPSSFCFNSLTRFITRFLCAITEVINL